MSIEEIRERWAQKRCPFGVAERCVTTDCAAWREQEDEYQSQYVYRREESKPGWFSDWELDKEITEGYEVRTGGGDYSDIFETRSRVVGYVWRKEVTAQTQKASGWCTRM